MTNSMRLGVIAAALAVAVIAFVLLKPGGHSNRPAGRPTVSAQGHNAAEPGPVRITVKGGKPVGGIKTITVAKGTPVRFVVESDVADEIHVHGYSLKKDVPAGGTVRFDFPARIDGIFVIELESRSRQIASLKVQP